MAQSDSTYQKKEVSKNDIQVIMGYYSQDGRHSAVTGGEGTEELSVKSGQVIYVRKTDRGNKWKYKTSVDQVTSASTDQINSIESSASLVDHRVEAQVGFSTNSSAKIPFTINIGSSIESDYWSRSISVGTFGDYKSKLNYTSQFSFFWDDLRWGWVKLGQWKGDRLIYPSELRYKKWFEVFHRNSFSFSNSVTWNASKRMKMGVSSDIVFQSGLLSTPFHRVFFNDGAERVENFPSTRLKIPIGFNLNYFVGNRIILKTFSRIYWDTFGVTSFTQKIELPIKMKYWIWVNPFVRYYVQQGADFFNPFGTHSIDQEFYTSDYDLSSLSSYNYGVYIKLKQRQLKSSIKQIQFRLENYRRSDQLRFWQTSVLIEFNF